MLPREKLLKLGVDALTSSELFSMIIGSGSARQDVFALSEEIVNRPDFQKSLLDKRTEFWTKVIGIGPVKAARIVAGVELARRLFFPESENVQIRSSKDVFLHFRTQVAGKGNESFYVLCLNAKNQIVFSKEIHSGHCNYVIADMKTLFSTILQTGALSFICVHNHPSGDVKPSEEDRELTKKIQQASSYLDLQFLDHVIVSINTHYSFYENESDLFTVKTSA